MATLNQSLGIPHAHVRLVCDDPPANLRLLLGEGAPRISGGMGGWEVIGRPRQVGMTIWSGVEPDLRTIVAVGRGDGDSAPGICRLVGLPLPADRWVLEGIEFQEGAYLRADDGSRIRQGLTLTLREYVPPSYLQLKRGALQGTKGKTKVIAARHGDTPAHIANRHRCGWVSIRELNPAQVKKANQPIATGARLRVPVAETQTKKSARRT